ncbi:MAG: hypothetical protein JWL79_276 [Frankiales bacterium]|nr:hypothetical protein [Frankiales bacterium]
MIRRMACTLGAAALLTPALIGLTAGAALASGSFSSPTPDNNSTLSGSPFQVKAATTAKGTSVSLTGPAGYSASKTSSTSLTAGNNQTVTLDPVDPSKYPNGTWTAKVSNGETRSFFSNFAPAIPSDFSVSTTDGDPNDVVLSWTKGTESDLQSYTLYDGNGAVLLSGITPDSACSGSSCHYSLYYNNPTPGTYTYSYRLSASRNGGCASSSCPAVESGQTATRSATLTTPTPPRPSPTPAPASGGSTGGGSSTGGTTGSAGGTTGGSTTGGSSTSGGSSTGGASNATTGGTTSAAPATLPTLDPNFQRRAVALNFDHFSASLGIPKLPPLPSTTVSLPGEAAVPNGTYAPTLPYKNAPQSAPVSHSSGILSPIASVTGIDTAKLAECLAFALILIMSAAHLRRWIGTHVED